MHIKADRPRGRQTHRPVDKQIHRKAGRQTHRPTNISRDRQTDKRNRHSDRPTYRQTADR